MRRVFHLSMLCLAAGIASACKLDEVVDSENIPTAGVRFINAVPDSAGALGMDFRFIDIVESNAAFRVTFRNNPQTSGGVVASTQIQYKNARAGARRFKIFLDDTLQSVASVFLKDSIANLEANHNYTFLLWGNARSTGSDRMRLTVIDETVTDPGAGKVALRVINATNQALDVRQYRSVGGTVPAAATWANVAPYNISSYQVVDTAQIRFNVRAAGGTASLFADQLALIGQPVGTATAGCVVGFDCEAIPGTSVAGSAITAIIFPRSAENSKAPQATAPVSFLAPVASFMWDRRPNRNCTSTLGC